MRWSHIRLDVVTGLGDARSIVDTQWDAKPLLDWLLTNRDALLHEDCPVLFDAESVAVALSVFYGSTDDYVDEGADRIYAYRRSHGLRFAMRGTDIPDVYIGRFGSSHQISSCTADESWSFEIDLEAFLANAEAIRRAIQTDE